MLARLATIFALVVLAAPLTLARDGYDQNGRPLVCDPTGTPDDVHRKCRYWIANVEKPDESGSCCGEADAFIADAYVERDGKYYAIITEDYPGYLADDGEGDSAQVPAKPKGTEIEIPAKKLNRSFDDDGKPIAAPNPTGHGIVFIGSSGAVLCYFSPTLS